ncbi:peptide-receptor component [Monoraphidium neglectum]|uniref:DNA-directed RNA polymerase III subunit RPC9 n=1 Tax=Monoraphidium neglectum TaxID=145388 RepID=A0A0D2MMT4_9CHLO|nr:peptide-receptor component [Monoraphidium neglectum]KIZ01872.1 peptide-receptor component [Monoraphidium neglectum]|eukprot:XP_013900891.1 peptide-receptor component [Monoraphidium neglectum]
MFKPCSLEKNAGLLTNSEVIEVLRYLQAHSAGELTRQQLDAFKEALQPFGLSRTELLQVLNLAPTSEVELHLVVENAEGRLGEERVAALLDVVAAHSPLAAQKRQGAAAEGAG